MRLFLESRLQVFHGDTRLSLALRLSYKTRSGFPRQPWQDFKTLIDSLVVDSLRLYTWTLTHSLLLCTCRFKARGPAPDHDSHQSACSFYQHDECGYGRLPAHPYLEFRPEGRVESSFTRASQSQIHSQKRRMLSPKTPLIRRF